MSDTVPVVTAHPDPPGYSPGTWEYRVAYRADGADCVCFDGGYASKKLAMEAGRRVARRVLR